MRLPTRLPFLVVLLVAACGSPHAGNPDAGPVGGVTDGGPLPDAGLVPDAGTPDAGACATPCGTFEYCGDDHQCHAGCGSGDQCSSGVCLDSHECQDCATSAECAPDHVCGTGVCAAACDPAQSGSCGPGGTCCGGACVDLTRDVNHCGACATACSADAFCNGTACESVAWTEVCGNPVATLLLDGQEGDDQAAVAIDTSLTQLCSAPGHSVRTLDALDAGVIDPDTGRPLTRGGELLIATGGSFRQKLVDYLEAQGITQAYDESTPDELRLASRDGGIWVDQPVPSLSDTHDFFILELVREPTRGSLSLVVYGYYGTGTEAGAYFFTHSVLASPASYAQRWYIVEWTDQGAAGPDAADTFTVLASGN